jgi:putative thiamine transport system permease protein
MEKKVFQVGCSLYLLKTAPYLCLFLLFVPVLSGLLGTLLPALGFFPALNSHTIGIENFLLLFASPFVLKSIFFSIYTGLLATIISLLIAFYSVIIFYESNLLAFVRKICVPLLAFPHAALAIAFSFLFVPSGFLARIFSPWLTSWERPPNLFFAQDSFSLIAALVCKETPFLILIILVATTQLPIQKTLHVGRAMGYYSFAIWTKCIVPQLYKNIRLPIYAVLVFSLSVIDMALIVGPQVPPVFAIRILEWFNHPADLNQKFLGLAGAVLLFFLCILIIVLWEFFVKLISIFGRSYLSNGKRGRNWKFLSFVFQALLAVICILIILGAASLLIWSFAKIWRFPSALPTEWSLGNWMLNWDSMQDFFFFSLCLGVLSSLISIVIVVLCLEREVRFFSPITSKGLLLIYIPLLIPQISSMFGFQIFLIKISLDGKFLAVLWSHLVFVLPYIFLTLGDTYRSFDKRYENISLGLGVSRWKFFWRVKIALLLEPILFAFAIGFAVSIALYVPTLFSGAGRINTITTEAVNLSSGSNRKYLGVYTSLQTILPFLIFVLAFFFRKALFLRKKIYYSFYLKVAR